MLFDRKPKIIKMKKKILIITVLLLSLSVILNLIVSCNNQKEENKNSTEPTSENFRWNNPDENATIEIINTKVTIGDKDLISKLEKDFKIQKFKIEKVEFIEENTYDNCKENLIIKIKGKGIKKYYVKRQESKPKNYYPDFIMWVYEFETEGETVAVKKGIKKALDSGNGFCNGKSPEYIIRYQNKIIHLGTRAEMFRGFIKNYADKIEHYK